MQKVNDDFLKELSEKKQKLKGIMGEYYKRQRSMDEASMTTEPTDESTSRIFTIEKLEWDFRRRMGNVLLKQIRSIQNLTFHRNPNRKYKMNDKQLKRNIAISRRKVGKALDGLFASVADLFMAETISHRNRLRELEEEIRAQSERENAVQDTPTHETKSKYDWQK